MRVVSAGPDILGCDLSGDYLGEGTVAAMVAALGACPRLTSLWLAHNELGPGIVDHLAAYILRGFAARIPAEDNPLLVSALAVARLRAELQALPPAQLLARAVKDGAGSEALRSTVAAAAAAAAAGRTCTGAARMAGESTRPKWRRP